MLEQQSGGDFPAIDVSLHLDASLDHILGTGELLHNAVLENVQQKLGDVVRLLGIPGTVMLDIGPLQAMEHADLQWMSLRVNGSLCRYSEEVLVFAWSYAAGRTADAKPAEVRSRLQEACAQAEIEGSQVAEFFGLACAEIISRQPAVLLGPAQAAAYCARLEGLASDQQPNPSPLDTSRLLPVLKGVLELRISIADTEKVAKVLGDSSAASWKDVAENLVDALAPDIVKLHVPETYITKLTTPDEKGSDLLTFARKMFDELGVVFPSFHPVPTTALKPNSFKFLINHLPTLPVVGLEAGECLVNDTSERLKLMAIEARAVVNPTTQQPAAVVDGTKKEQLEKDGLTTWDQAGYCVLCLDEALRRNCACFIRRRSIQIQLEQLSGACRALVKAAREKVSVEKITHVLRALGSENVSIRNLRLILERLLDYQYRASDLERYLILDDRLSLSGYLQDRHTDDLIPFVRAGLKRQISDQYARGTSTLVVYLVDPELENLFNGPNTDGAPDEDRQENLITALANEIMHLPPTAQTPSILTTTGVRAALRDAIKLRFPRVSVLAYQELMPDLNIQPVARILLR